MIVSVLQVRIPVKCHMTCHPARGSTQASATKSVVPSTIPELDKKVSSIPCKFRDFRISGPTQPNLVDMGGYQETSWFAMCGEGGI